MHHFIPTLLLVLVASSGAAAADVPELFPARDRVWQHLVLQVPVAEGAPSAEQAARPRVAAVEYSDAYKMRAKIHRYSSFAMLPLVATELYLGQSVYNSPSGGNRSAHVAVGGTIGVLCGVNTVTGVWNLWEARKDPNKRGRRIAHALLMMAADFGFVATAATAPGDEGFEEGFRTGNGSGSRSTHRAIAIASLATATTGYLIMLVGGR